MSSSVLASARLPPVQLKGRRSAGSRTQQLRTVVVDEASSKLASLGSFKRTSSTHKDHALHLLVAGYPLSYVEFFELTDGAFDDQQLREDDQLMLLLRSNLATIEELLRVNNYTEAFAKRSHLAKIFKEHGAVKHAQHHLEQAETVAVKSHNINLMVDARRELGALLEQQDDLEAAVRCYKNQLDDLEGASLSESNEQLVTAWRDLARTQLNLAKQQAQHSPSTALATISNAERFAVKGDDQTQLISIFLEAGSIHEQCQHIQQAIDYYNKFLTKMRAANMPSDGADQGRACLGLARCYDEQGDLALAREYLQNLSVLCDKTGQTALATETATRLGTLVARQGDFKTAEEWFSKAMSLARQLNDITLLSEIQVKAGISQSHCILPDVFKHLMSNTKEDLLKLLDWSFTRRPLT
eukprot:m.212728 g.212728  ORF g.212728 m.212728 type:complete len:413 (-) comp16949_c0_seq2:3509-4747(-)